MTVLNFPTSPQPEDRTYVTCNCGSAWFELCTIDADGTKNFGAVTMDDAGRVTGYSGTPHCVECGRERLP